MTILSALIIIACFMVGGYYQFFSDKIDSAPEQVAENILLTEQNIKVDFSAGKKKKLTEQKDNDAKKD